MKRMFVVFLAMTQLTFAGKWDVYFKGNGDSFIDTDRIVVNGKPSLRYSFCQNHQNRWGFCKDLAIINIEAIEKVQSCLNTSHHWAVAGAVGSGVMVGVSALFTFGAGLFLVGGTAGAYSLNKLGEISESKQVFSEKVKYDDDHILDDQNIEAFKNQLAGDIKDLLKSCKVAGQTEKTSSQTYWIHLTLDQIRMLKDAKEMD